MTTATTLPEIVSTNNHSDSFHVSTGYGRQINEAVSAEQALKLGNLDFHVNKIPVEYTTENGERKIADGQFVNVRSDNGASLGVVGERYKLLQNREAFAFMDEIVGNGLASYEAAGVVNGGKTVWMMAKLPGSYDFGASRGVDTVYPYVLLVNTFDGSRSVQIIPTTRRMNCNNMLHSITANARRQNNIYSLRHTKTLADKIGLVKTFLGNATDDIAATMAIADQMANRQLSVAETQHYLDLLFPSQFRETAPAPAIEQQPATSGGLFDQLMQQPAKIESTPVVVDGELPEGFAATKRIADRNGRIQTTIRENMANERNAVDGIRGTLWSAYNAVSEYADHQKTVRGATAAERSENRAFNNFFGTANELKNEAFAVAETLIAS